MLTIQSLYEAKLLSYPRTDCTYSTDEEFDYLVDNLTKYLDLVSNPVSLTVLLQSLKIKRALSELQIS
ncbi:hypothetical protein EFO08_03660 [Lactococcus cremoris]|nr:hypothetical protein [Lactococcus cremoris]